jgi:ubiquinone biosynthesis protein
VEDAESDQSPRTSAARFRLALEELGGAFVKLGQILSTRPDILPRNWIEELSRLQDEVKPVDFSRLKPIIEEDLGPLEENFQLVDPEPLATASIAQVHRAVTTDGQDVVIKIRKPGVKKKLIQDCSILEAAAQLLEKHVPESANYRPVQMVQEFQKAVTEELDFTVEGRNLDHFRTDFESHPHIVFPKPYWDQTSESVLTMERIDGLKISALYGQSDQSVDTRQIADILAEAVLRQILEYGFFHSDPHPGNIMVLQDCKVCFLDCGMVGHLDERTRENLVLLVAAGIRKELDVVTDLLIDMNALPDDLDRNQFMKEASLFLERYYRRPLKRISLKSIVEEAMALINKFHIQVPSDMVLVGKALVTVEGVGRNLNPDFDAVAVASPYIRELVLVSYGPHYIGRSIMEASRDILRLVRTLPGDLRELSRNIRENQVRIVVEHQRLKESFQLLYNASRWISTSIIIASLVLGSSIVMGASSEPRFMGLPILTVVGLAVAGVLGLGLVIEEIFRRKP